VLVLKGFIFSSDIGVSLCIFMSSFFLLEIIIHIIIGFIHRKNLFNLTEKKKFYEKITNNDDVEMFTLVEGDT
jgi:wobble nucleotide-excising tRNase